MQPETQIINNCIGLLEQAIALIEQIDDDVYVSTSPMSPRGSIGGHLRHILDYSLVAMLLRLHEIDPGEDFGVAASTLRYWKEEATCAQ